ncbi:MAG TPA: glycosyltransferase [Silvibacterium sp.]|nr:glycosyltransferase [Silvibacterium sp.]
MPMTVLSIAFPFAPVGTNAVGGAEQVLSYLDYALVAAGHTSLVAACEGSQPAGELFSVRLPSHDVLSESDRSRCRSQFQAAIDRAIASRPIDLIHMHGLDFGEYKLPPQIPVLVTLHLPIAWYGKEVWHKPAVNLHFCCVSEAQRQSFNTDLRSVTVVENGVQIPPSSCKTPKKNFALTIGRICPEKNAHAALEAGTLAGTQVLIGGQVFPYREHRQYFEEKIQPLLWRSPVAVGHKFLGPLAAHQKQDLLPRAKCLLHPTLAPETSSLVAMEAMAAGTPVIAYRSGALREIVDDGITGFLVENVKEMAEAIRQVHTISPENCRAAAKARFSKDRMVGQYFALYESLQPPQQPVALHA